VRVLVACEFSGIVRDAFARRGHDAWSCDLLPSETPGNHYHGDVRDLLVPGAFHLLIAHPPCTYLSRAGARWWNTAGRAELADRAAELVFALRDAPIERIAIENPIGQLNSRWRKPDQTIQPWMFGHPFTKATCLWLKRLPPLVPTFARSERAAFLPSNTGKGRREGQRSQPGVVGGGKDASRTFLGIAEAMADQWGSLDLQAVA
jgi:hypothetical protein